ncbi:receptor-like protein 12 [Cucumis melo var. makuwa]|uniref:Receptor-like protein 12 n=1 Tax=Cucumis melo var. makuwa TaxID=1194695 RepID=A0A5A7TEQ6_CUCMM|nr:receptor-like protein 12 [Cucumis melo var. makuwa]
MALLYQLQVYYFLLFLFLFFSSISVLVNSQHDHDNNNNVLCDPTQSFALLQFKNSFSLGTPSSSCSKSYPRTTTWNESTDCCLWDGVECDDKGEGHVVALHLGCSFLHGTLHPNNTIFTLSHLQTLNLSSNCFSGSPLSPRFGMLTNLRVLDLSKSSFYGDVPLEIAYLSNLVSLHLSYNDLSFSNVVMKEIVQNLTNLRDFSLASTHLLGIIPTTSFMNFSRSLESLDLSLCDLSGNFSDHIFGLPNLRVLRLLDNPELSGHLPQSKWSKSLEILDVSETSFSGKIPKSIGEARALKYLDLSLCKFHGKIPNLQSYYNTFNNCVFNLTQQASSNSTANVCSDILPNLIHLNLKGNSFTSSVPSWIYSLPCLKYLDLSDIHFSGFMRDFKSNSLEFLDLSNNNFQDILRKVLHPSICQATKLTYLNLFNNSLSGAVPSCLSNMTNLQVLILRSNNFTGAISIPPSIQYYIASENHFIGEIPLSICLAVNLTILVLSNNYMSGKIPPGLTNISLQVLNLNNNNFSGTIPNIFSRSGCQLSSLLLNNNQLEGELPQSLLYCHKLRVLDLGNNKNMTGHFPFWLESALNLQVLILRSNRFHGHINDSFNKYSFSNLRIIDLSRNNFNGQLPSNFFKNMRAIKEEENHEPNSFSRNSYYSDSVVISYKGFELKWERILLIFKIIDLSSNGFNGEIPKEIGLLRSLQGLNLSRNKFTGEFPTSLGNLNNLELLDLSSNELCGNIPPQLVGLTFLSYLNLSSNHLSGPIPQGHQFDTFESSSYFGNLGLCGNPLPINCDSGYPKDNKGDSSKKGIWLKAVFMGYVCGIVFGVFIGYLVFHCGKPMWIVAMVERKLKISS